MRLVRTGTSLAALTLLVGAVGVSAAVLATGGSGVAGATTPSGPNSITTTSLPAGIVGVPYSFQLEAIGGAPPYTCNKYGPVGRGQLPWHVSLSRSGLISGTPKHAGTYTFTVKCLDSSHSHKTQATATFTLVIAAAPVTVFVQSPDPIVGGYPPTGNIVPSGPPGTTVPTTVTFAATNPNPVAVKVTTVSLVTVTSPDAACQAVINQQQPQFWLTPVGSTSLTGVPVPENVVIPAHATDAPLPTSGSLYWLSTPFDQNACLGQTMTVTLQTP